MLAPSGPRMSIPACCGRCGEGFRGNGASSIRKPLNLGDKRSVFRRCSGMDTVGGLRDSQCYIRKKYFNSDLLGEEFKFSSFRYDPLRHSFYSSAKRDFKTLGVRALSSSTNSENPLIDENGRYNFTSIEQTLKIIADKMNALGIFLETYNFGDYRLVCPKCEGGTSNERCFSLSIKPDVVQWNCFRAKCGFRGIFNPHDSTTKFSTSSISNSKSNFHVSPYDDDSNSSNLQFYQEIKLDLKELDEELISFFKSRGINELTLKENKISKIYAYPPNTKQKSIPVPSVIAFPYFRQINQKDVLVHCKFRAEGKSFWQTKGSQKIFYGLNDIRDEKEIVIVEGEIDKLSLYEAGIKNCVSVPNGAPAKLRRYTPTPEKDKSFSYIWNCREYLQDVEKIVIATDSDAPGQILAEELARRLGKERCYKVTWPEYDGGICKDANEVLMRFGSERLRNLILNSTPYPVRGLFHFSDYFSKLDGKYDQYYNQQNSMLDVTINDRDNVNNHFLGYSYLASTGWKSLDQVYKVAVNELTVICGLTNVGKTEFVHSLIINLNKKYNWKFALCCLESEVGDVGVQLIEKFYEKPLLTSDSPQNQTAINKEEFERGVSWLDQNFHFIRSDDRSPSSIDWVLDVAKSAVQISGINGLIVDSFSQLDHLRPSHLTETEYASFIMSKLKQFALMNKCHVWLLTNAKKRNKFQSHNFDIMDVVENVQFANKPDNILFIHRELNDTHVNAAGTNDATSNEIEVIVKKVRNKLVGKLGIAKFSYNRSSGKFTQQIISDPIPITYKKWSRKN